MTIPLLASLAVMALSGLPGQAAAQNGLTSEFFSNAGTGHGRMSLELASLDAQSASIGNPAPSSSSTTTTGGKFGGGYVSNQKFSMEDAHHKLRSFSYSNPSLVPTVGVNMKGTAWRFFGVGTFPISSGFSAFGKLGVADLQAYSNSTNKNNFAWGLGAQYDFTPNMAVQFEYKNFGNVSNAPNFPASTGTTSLISLGALYRF